MTVLVLVHFYFVAATCCRKCTHGATTLLSQILSLRSVARIQTGLNRLVSNCAATKEQSRGSGE